MVSAARLRIEAAGRSAAHKAGYSRPTGAQWPPPFPKMPFWPIGAKNPIPFTSLNPARDILDEVASAHNLRHMDIMSPTRAKVVGIARQDLMYRLMAQLGWSSSRVGHFIGRDHSTVLYGIQQHCLRHSLPRPGGLTAGRKRVG